MNLSADHIKTYAAAGLALAAVGAVLYVMARGFKGAAQDGTRAAIGLLDGAATGTVLGIGEAFGIPETNADQCTADLAAGNTWEASKSCPAGRFIGSFF